MRTFAFLALFALFAMAMAAETKKDLQASPSIGLGYGIGGVGLGYGLGLHGLYGGYGLGLGYHRLGLLGLGYGGIIG